jgi:uncharacterized protein (DUF1800 family)
MPDRNTNIDPATAWLPLEPAATTPWDRARVRHLFRRAAFGSCEAQVEAALGQSPLELARRLTTAPKNAGAFDEQMQSLGRTILASGNPRSLSAWWLYRMLHTPDAALEKLTLFWHGHFATSAAKVESAPAMLAQNALFREHARGDFAALVRGVSRDPAMLIYLDSTTNRKIHPNENYAREVLELFCLGIGNYTEHDIQQVARCFTGWEVRRGQFRFNPYQHDTGVKTFLGASGDFDGDDAVRVVLDQSAAARFIARKLVRFYVTDEAVPDALVEPLAQELRDRDFQIAPVLQTIFASRWFYSAQAMGRKIRSPVDLAVGLLRSLEATTNVYQLAEDLDRLGQAVFFPPNVKGWDGGRTWINSSTVLGRANLVRRLMHGGETRFAGGSLADVVDRHASASPAESADWLLETLLAMPAPETAREKVVELLAEGRSRPERLADAVHLISTLPEFHLA